MSDAAAIEAERLALSTAQARVVQALDALAAVSFATLDADDRLGVREAEDALWRVYRSLERRLRG